MVAPWMVYALCSPPAYARRAHGARAHGAQEKKLHHTTTTDEQPKKSNLRTDGRRTDGIKHSALLPGGFGMAYSHAQAYHATRIV